ncbi:MAG: ATP-binding protein [Agathobacter sp.]|nr:ATP-binding protein [Agathobacter sp.]
MPKLHLVCGLSGTGKTEYSKKLAKQLDILRVSPDDIYAMFNGSDLDRRNKFEVWQTLFLIINTALKNNRDIIVDTNAVTKQQRAEIVGWFPEFEKHLILIEAPEELRRENNKQRTRVIPEKNMDRMLAKYERPEPDEEGWMSITYLYNENNTEFKER